MKTYPLYEVAKELIREGGYQILDFRWLDDLAKRFRLQPFYAEGEVIEFEDDFSDRTPCYAEGEIVCSISGIEIMGNNILVDYAE